MKKVERSEFNNIIFYLCFIIMFTMHTRPSKRISSLPMKRKDKERAKLERIVVRNKQNGLTNVSSTNLVNSLQQEILYLEEKPTGFISKNLLKFYKDKKHV